VGYLVEYPAGNNSIQVVASVALTGSEPSLVCSKDAPKILKLGLVGDRSHWIDALVSEAPDYLDKYVMDREAHS
jgi:hypothetical protein